MTLTKPCTKAPFCAKKSRENLLFGPDCAKVASRKSAKTVQIVCFYKRFMTFWFYRRCSILAAQSQDKSLCCAGFQIRRNWDADFRIRKPARAFLWREWMQIGFRNCFEFLQKVFSGLMYSFSCVLWAIFRLVSLLSSSNSPLSSSSRKQNRLENSSQIIAR